MSPLGVVGWVLLVTGLVCAVLVIAAVVIGGIVRGLRSAFKDKP